MTDKSGRMVYGFRPSYAGYRVDSIECLGFWMVLTEVRIKESINQWIARTTWKRTCDSNRQELPAFCAPHDGKTLKGARQKGHCTFTHCQVCTSFIRIPAAHAWVHNGWRFGEHKHDHRKYLCRCLQGISWELILPKPLYFYSINKLVRSFSHYIRRHETSRNAICVPQKSSTTELDEVVGSIQGTHASYRRSEICIDVGDSWTKGWMPCETNSDGTQHFKLGHGTLGSACSPKYFGRANVSSRSPLKPQTLLALGRPSQMRAETDRAEIWPLRPTKLTTFEWSNRNEAFPENKLLTI